MQEILLRLAKGLALVAAGQTQAAAEEAARVVRHIESHGCSAELEACDFEERESYSGGD
jgi:hypothetical protein